MGKGFILSENEKRTIQKMYGIINEQEETSYLASCTAAGGFPKFLKDNNIKFNKTLDVGVRDQGVENGNFKDDTKPSCYAFYGGDSSKDYENPKLKDYYAYDVRKKTFFKMKEEGVNESETLNEDKNLNIVNLVTKYRGGLEGFFNQLNAMVDRDSLQSTCSDLPGTTKKVTGKLDDFINRIAIDMKVKPQEAVKQLYDLGNSGLLKVVKPLLKADGVEMSSEVLDLVENHMRSKYGQYGSALNSMLNDLYASSGVVIKNFCKQQSNNPQRKFTRA